MESPQCTLPARARRLSEIALDARETISLTRGYPTTRQVYQAVLSVIEGLRQSTRPMIIFVVGDWGEGKTSTYNAIIEAWCRERGVRCPKIVASKLVDVLENVAARGWGERLLYAILYTALSEMGVEAGGSLQELWEAFSRATGASPGNPAIVFIDEFEYLVSLFESRESRRRELVAGVLEGLTQIANGEVQGVPLHPRPAIHLVIAVSRQARTVLQERLETSQIIGRLMRREVTVELKRFTILESLGYLDSLVRLLYEGRVDASKLARPATLLNPLAHASGGLPAAIERGVNTVTDALSALCGGGSSARLDASIAPDVYAATKIVIEAMEVQPVVLDAYRLVEEECVAQLGGGLAARRACRLLLFSLQGVKPDVLAGEIDASLDRARVILDELASWGYAIPGRLYRLVLDVGEGLERLYAVTARILEEDEAIRAAVQRLTPEPSAETVYRLLLDPFSTYCPNGGVCLNVPIEARLPDELRDRLGVDEATAERLAEAVARIIEAAIAAGILREEGEAYLVPFELQSRYVFSHELAMLRFIPREERLEVWKRVAQKLPPSHVARGLLVFAAGAVLDVLRLKPGEARLRILSEEDGALLAEVAATEARTIDVHLGTRLKRRLVVPARIRFVIGDLAAVAAMADGVSRASLRARPHAVIVFSVGAARLPEEKRQVLEDAGIAVVHVSLQRVTGIRLAALGHQLEAYRGAVPLEERVMGLIRYSRGESVEQHLLEGFEPLALQAALGELAREVDVARLQEELRESLSKTGALLPERLEVGGEGVRREDVRDAALWLLHYPAPLDEKLVPRPVPAGEVYREIIGSARRFTIYGKRYTGIVGRDIESPEELFRVTRALEAIGLAKVAPTGIVLSLSSSPYVSRLVGNAEVVERLEDIAELYIDRHGDAIAALVEALAALGVVSVEDGRVRVASRGSVEQRLARLTRMLEDYWASYKTLASKMGVLVYAKERAVNVSSVKSLYKAIRSRVEGARRILHRSHLEANRLLESAERLAEGILGLGEYPECRREGCSGKCSEESRYTPLVIAADVEYRKRLRAAEELVAGLRNALEQFKRNLGYIAEGVEEVESPLLESLERLIGEAKRLYEEELDETRVKTELAGIANARSVFDFRVARSFCYNYKLWKLSSILPETGGVLEEAEHLAEVLRSNADEIRRVYEATLGELQEIRNNLKSLASRLESLGIRLASGEPSTPLRRVQAVDRVLVIREPRDADRLVGGLLHEWKRLNNIDVLRELVKKVENLVSRVEELRKEGESLARLAEERASRATSLAERASSIAAEAASLLLKANEAYNDALLAYRSTIASQAAWTARDLEEAAKLLEELEARLRDTIGALKAKIEEGDELVTSAAEGLAKVLEEKVKSYEIVSSLAKLGIREALEAEKRVSKVAEVVAKCRRGGLDCIEELLEAARLLRELSPPEALVRETAARLGLSDEEVKVLALIASRGGHVPVTVIARELGLEKKRVLEILARLEEKGLIELYAGARRG